MLFRKDIPKDCSYCQHMNRSEDGAMRCTRGGTVNEDEGCRQFRYDPTRRKPKKAKAMDFSRYDEDDFSL